MAIKNNPVFTIKDPLKSTPDLHNIPVAIKQKAAEKVAAQKGSKTALKVEKSELQPSIIPSAQELEDNRMNTAKQRSEFLWQITPQEQAGVLKMKQEGKHIDYVTDVIATQRRLWSLTPEEIQGLQEAKKQWVDPLTVLDTIEKARLEQEKESEVWPFYKGIVNTAVWMKDQFVQWAESFHDLLNRGSNALDQWLDQVFWTDSSRYQLETNPQESAASNIANIFWSSLNLSAAWTLPLATAILWTVSETPWIKQVMNFVSDKSSQWIWLLTNQIPWYSELPEDAKQNLNSALANTVMTVLWGRTKAAPIKEKIANITDRTWLKPAEKSSIKSNPYVPDEFTKFKEGVEQQWLTPQEVMKTSLQEVTQGIVEQIDQKISKLRETWPLYESIKKNPKQLDITEVKTSDVGGIIKEFDIKVNSKWELDFSQSNIWSTTDMRKIQAAYDRINGTPDVIDSRNGLNLRQALDDMANYEEWATSKSNTIIKRMRSSIDKKLKSEIPWLKQADDLFSRQITELNEAKRGIINTKTWEPLARAYSKIKNVESLWNTKLAETIDKYFPWTREKIDAIQQAKKLYDIYERPARTSLTSKITSKIVEWSIASAVAHFFWPIYGIGSFILSHFIEEGFNKYTNKLKNKQIEKIVSDMSFKQMDKLQEIGNKISQRQSLDASDKQAIQDTMNIIKDSIWEQQMKIDYDKILKSLEKWLPYIPEVNTNLQSNMNTLFPGK